MRHLIGANCYLSVGPCAAPVGSAALRSEVFSRMSAGRAPLHCLTFDVEEHFQVNAFDSADRRRGWAGEESRVERNTEKILELLERHRYRATFFVLGWVAERNAKLIERIAALGHEVASHGYGHELVTKLSPDAFREDVRTAKKILEDVTGAPITGYRAPSFTIMPSTRYALEVLVQEGYTWDSSVVPVVHDVYGWPGADPYLHRIETGSGPLWELPPSTAAVPGARIAIGGGGHFRIYPYPLVRTLLRRIEKKGAPIVFYLHPWEVDPDQPRMAGSRLSRFRHYRNLDKVETRLERLFDDFRFASVREVLPKLAQAQEPMLRAPTSAPLARAR
jgi:polysaccharide deacetylase family protein (PEP-CTERM system associated)